MIIGKDSFVLRILRDCNYDVIMEDYFTEILDYPIIDQS